MENKAFQINERLERMNRSALGSILVLIASAFWGTSGIFVAIILENSNGTPVSLAFWRDVAAFVILFLFALLTHPRNLIIARKDLPWFVSMGFFLGGFHILYNHSVALNGVAVTTVLQTAMPGVVTVAAFYLWNEPVTRDKIGSFILIFIGTAMASGFNIFFLGQTDIVGLVSGLSVPFLYAGWTLCGKNMVQKYGPAACLAIAFGVASILLLPLQPFTSQPFPLDSTLVTAFCGFILISTVCGFSLYFLGMNYIQAGIASILVMSEIFFAGIYAWFFLDERLSLVESLGTALVVIGVLWLSFRQNNPKKSRHLK